MKLRLTKVHTFSISNCKYLTEITKAHLCVPKVTMRRVHTLLKSQNNVLFTFRSRLLSKVQFTQKRHSKKICCLIKSHQS